MEEMIGWFDQNGGLTPKGKEESRAMRARIDARILRAFRGAQMADQLPLSDVILGMDVGVQPPVSIDAPINRHERRRQAKRNRR